MTSHWPLMISYDFFNFGPSFSFFFLKISLLEMLIAFGNEHLKNWKLTFHSPHFQHPVIEITFRSRWSSWSSISDREWASLSIRSNLTFVFCPSKMQWCSCIRRRSLPYTMTLELVETNRSIQSDIIEWVLMLFFQSVFFPRCIFLNLYLSKLYIKLVLSQTNMWQGKIIV